MGSLQTLSYGTGGGRPAIDKRPVYTGLFYFWENSDKKIRIAFPRQRASNSTRLYPSRSREQLLAEQKTLIILCSAVAYEHKRISWQPEVAFFAFLL